MAQMQLPAATQFQRTSYTGLLGADFSVDPSLVDKRHSPDLLNMISDNGANPVKRKGWEVVVSDVGKVDNIWSFDYDGNMFIVFTGRVDGTNSKLYCVNQDGEQQTLSASDILLPVGKLGAFYTEASEDQYGLYILAKTSFHRIWYDEGIHYEQPSPYVPTVIISGEPTGGGQVYEEINLLTNKRIEQFLNTANNKTFKLSASPKSGSVRVWHLTSNGNWVEESSGDISVSGSTVTLTTAYSPPVVGSDNIRIQYETTSTDRSPRVLRCVSSAHFSQTVQDQIFLAGNPYRRNTVYYSAFGNPTYFPDTNYLNIGGETIVMGFLNLGEYLAVVKEGTSDDSTIFLVYPTTYSSEAVTTTISDGEKTTTTTESVHTFAVKRSIAGIGAVSKNCFGVLNDEPLFLSPFGVYGITSTNVLSERIVRNRSFLLEKKLNEETKLKNAVATIWNNYYVLAVGGDEYKNVPVLDEDGNQVYEDDNPVTKQVSNGRVYVLDGRHKTNNYNGNTSYGYEAYYWEGVPAICITSCKNEMWFGTAHGEVCRFKNSGQATDYSDGTIKGVDNSVGEVIVATWSTPNDNDGLSEYYKTMSKKGSMCTVAPFNKSSVKVYVRVDGYPRQYIGKAFVDISGMFDGEIDFGRLSFDQRTTPRDFFFKKKKKKYQRIQIILENDELNEPFGIHEIVKTYVVQKFAKNTGLYAADATTTETGLMTHTIRVELEDDDGDKSLGFGGSRWK